MDNPDSRSLANLESTLLKKIEEINAKISEEREPEQLHKLGVTLSTLLENLEKTRKTKRT